MTMPYTIWEELNTDEDGEFVTPRYGDTSEEEAEGEVVEKEGVAAAIPSLRPLLEYLDPAHPVRYIYSFPFTF